MKPWQRILSPPSSPIAPPPQTSIQSPSPEVDIVASRFASRLDLSSPNRSGASPSYSQPLAAASPNPSHVPKRQLSVFGQRGKPRLDPDEPPGCYRSLLQCAPVSNRWPIGAATALVGSRFRQDGMAWKSIWAWAQFASNHCKLIHGLGIYTGPFLLGYTRAFQEWAWKMGLLKKSPQKKAATKKDSPEIEDPTPKFSAPDNGSLASA